MIIFMITLAKIMLTMAALSFGGMAIYEFIDSLKKKEIIFCIMLGNVAIFMLFIPIVIWSVLTVEVLL